MSTASTTSRGHPAWVYDGREEAVEGALGLDLSPGLPVGAPGEHLVGYHASGTSPILRTLALAPVREGDVLVDLGSGLGKVVLLTALLTRASARGVEIQPELVRRARASAERLGLGDRASFVEGDACDDAVPLDDGTVFFLYAPFTGPALRRVVARVEAVAATRPIVVAALGVDLDFAPRLSRRNLDDLDDFWLALYDGGARRT